MPRRSVSRSQKRDTLYLALSSDLASAGGSEKGGDDHGIRSKAEYSVST